MNEDFIHLHVHGCFSVQDGLPSPADLIKAGRKLGFSAMALTDHGNMGGHYQFAKAAANSPVRPIFGIEGYLCDDVTVHEHVPMKDANGIIRMRRPKHSHVVLLAKDQAGYDNLLELARIGSSREAYYYEPRFDWSHLSKHAEGLVCLSACIAGEVGRSIREDRFRETPDIVDRYRQTFGDDFYLEIQHHKMKDEAKVYKEIVSLADEMGIKVVATNDVHYVAKKDAKGHSLVVAMRFMRDERAVGSGDDRNLSAAYKQPEFYLKTKEEMWSTFENRPDALLNTLEVAEKCQFEFPLKGGIIWPEFRSDTGIDIEHDDQLRGWRDRNVPDENLKQAFLTRQAWRGLKAMGKQDDPVYVKRLRHELDAIYDLGYEEYFLVQWQICRKAKELKILMGAGRGCLTGDTQVLTNDGFVPLRDVSVGTKVFSHTGEQRVVEETFKYAVSGERLLRIKTDNSFDDIVLTPDHRVYGVSPDESVIYQRVSPATKKKIRRWQWDHSPRWIAAEDLKKNDLLFMPFPNRVVTQPQTIDLAEYATDKFDRVTDTHIVVLNPLTGREARRFDRYIPFDADFAYLLGYWIGDGWMIEKPSANKLCFGLAFHADDQELIDRFTGYFESMGFRPKMEWAKTRKLAQMNIYNKVFTRAIKAIFPDYQRTCHSKYIGSLKHLPDDLLRSLMLGLKHADGSTEQMRSCRREHIDTVSLRLALDIKETLLYLRIPSSVVKREYHNLTADGYQCRDSYKVRFAGLEVPRGNNSNNMIQNDGYYVRIKSIEEDRAEEVFDIRVAEEHSYLTANYAVHNSGSGSLALYCLGITKLDPMKYGLIFERFLNPGRGPIFDQKLPLPEFEVRGDD